MFKFILLISLACLPSLATDITDIIEICNTDEVDGLSLAEVQSCVTDEFDEWMKDDLMMIKNDFTRVDNNSDGIVTIAEYEKAFPYQGCV